MPVSPVVGVSEIMRHAQTVTSGETNVRPGPDSEARTANSVPP